MSGHVCTIDATQVFTSIDGSKHVITVVGLDASVQSYEDLTEDKIMVLDCANAIVQPMGLSREEGGNDRSFFTQRKDGQYAISVPKETFLNEQVNNEAWQAKYNKGKPQVLIEWQAKQADEDRFFAYGNFQRVGGKKASSKNQ